MLMEAGLVLSRFLHYAALLVLFGGSLFPLYAYRGFSHPLPPLFARRQQATTFTAATGTLLSGILWFLFTVASMTDTLSAASDEGAVWSVLADTSFGRVWLVRLALMILAFGLIVARVSAKSRGPDRAMPLIAAGLLASLAGVGHTQVDEGLQKIIHIASDAVHLLAAGAWLGGLLPLGFLLALTASTAKPDAIADTSQVLARFSGMGYLAVAGVVGSGLINSWFLVGSFSNLLATAYGQLVALKVVLFAGMLLLAVLNRFWLVPALTGATGMPGPPISLIRLRRHVLGEQLLGILVIFAVAILGTLPPAISQSP
jgi:putative copper resistance protein D